ncbi:putative double-strand recombination repair protein [Hamiltosporidium magnivora]|uniref:Putative double-strand recombination repair protein n=1 Tax=Hamiltosporidium magnivora TaxID=148818 RepID=A0A4Q9KUM3_9MICR|nr:putative double-strand recombination repair protein [Hamiltosporidium magnivora]
MVFITEIKEDEKENYEEIIVDTIKFYKRKEITEPSKRKKSITKPKRYSDQFKTSAFLNKDMHRKLCMIEKFRKNKNNLDFVIEKWRNCVEECLNVLITDYFVGAKDIFKSFKLENYGFKYEDYGDLSDYKSEEEQNEEM